MRKFRLPPMILTLLFVGTAALSQTNAPESESKAPIKPEDGVIRLFNGKDLTNLYTRLDDTLYKDPRKVFTVHDGMLHLSGDGFGGVITKDAYRDYHLVLEFKWGPRTWGKRKERAKDSGIMFHCTGPEDSFGGRWPESFQAQMVQGGTGDMYVVKANGPVELSLEAEVEERGGKFYWKKGGERREFTRGGIFWPGKDPEWKNVLGFRGKNDVESPDGKWTRMEVICDGDHVEIKVNGVTTNEGFHLDPSAGKILIQVEGAELLIRRWELWPLGEAPDLKPIEGEKGKKGKKSGKGKKTGKGKKKDEKRS